MTISSTDVANFATALEGLATLFKHPEFNQDIDAASQITQTVMTNPTPVSALAGVMALLVSFGIKF
jgi:hypothetical protein